MTETENIKSPAKKKVIEFLYATRGKDEDTFIFSVKGDKYFAEDFVHRMRVELSRLRKANEKRGKTNRPFKILLKDVKELSTGETKITLLKTMKNQEVFDGVGELFDLLGKGNRING